MPAVQALGEHLPHATLPPTQTTSSAHSPTLQPTHAVTLAPSRSAKPAEHCMQLLIDPLPHSAGSGRAAIAVHLSCHAFVAHYLAASRISADRAFSARCGQIRVLVCPPGMREA
jgi:hypothetical protein